MSIRFIESQRGMMNSMKLVAMVGSLRRDSYNLHLVETMQERYRDRMEIELADIRSLPYYDQDEEEQVPSAVVHLKQQVAAAEGVLIATPEYNWSYPAVLKNALDWLSRGDRELQNKPVLVMGASPFMMGTLRAQQHLRDVLMSPGIGARTLPPGGNEVLLTFAKDKFQNGRLVDESTLTFLDGIVDKFVTLVESAK